MAVIQLHEPALYDFRRLVVAGDADGLTAAAQDIHNQIQNAENGFLFMGIFLKQKINTQRFPEVLLILRSLLHPFLIASG